MPSGSAIVLILILMLGHAHSDPKIINPLPYLQAAFGWLAGSTEGPTNEEPPLDAETLKFSAIITRHGSRSPLMTYPNDPYPYYDLNYWPAGVGQLTKYGHQQLYVSGQNYRRRYNGFLPLEYNVNNTLARTNLYDRDFMSAACFLAGLFPPQGYQLWNPKIPWQPIPIWEEPFDVSDLVRVCPSYAVETVKATKELNDQLLDANRELLDYLSVNSGINITTIGEIHSIWDALTMQFENGYKLPSWAKSVYPDKMAPLYAEMFYSAVGGTPKMIRLTGGPVIRNVSNMLNSKAAGSMKPAGRLVYLEAAHDFTLQALLAALGITNKMLINTSASMAFELHKPRLAEYHVQVIYYNDSSTAIPYHMKVPSCGDTGICSLAEFNEIVDSVAPDDWADECQLGSS